MKFISKNMCLIIDQNVCDYLSHYMQIKTDMHEAGGQLFGKIEETTVFVKVATGPYRFDKRSRNSYRSCPIAAQKSINTQLKNGLDYLGEWHTHAEQNPQISSL